MRICLVINTLEMGGAERVISLLSNEFSKSHEVLLLETFSSRRADGYYIDERVNRRLFCERAGSKSVFAKILFLRESIQHFKPERVISFLTNVNFLVLLAGLNLKCQVTISERVDFRLMDEPFTYKILRRLLYPLANKLAVQTVEIKELCEQLSLNGNIEVIPNPIKLPITTNRYERVRLDSIIKIIMVGRLEEQKNYSLAINVLANLPDNIVLDIYGEGRLLNSLKKEIASKSLSSRVEFKGRTSEILEKFIDYDIFLHTSSFEGMPNAVLEASCTGIPCVVVDSGSGTRVLSEDFHNITLVGPNLSDLVESILLNINRLNSERKVVVPTRYSLNDVCGRWLK